jgi:PAS domain-containing protein
MEITKFSSQLFAALEQVTVHLRRALNTLIVWGKSVLEKTRRLQETRRATDVRKVLASSFDAIIVTSGKITKFSSQLFAALEQVTAHLGRALNTVIVWRKSVLEKARRLQVSCRANDLRKVLASSLDAVVVTSYKITKFSSQLFVALEQVTAHLRRAPNTLTKLGKSALEETRRLQETRRATDLRKVLASSVGAIVVTSGKITKFSSQLFAALEQATVYLRRALNTLTGRAKNALEKPRRLQETRRARANDLRELLASSVDAIVVTNVDRRFVAANPKALHLFGVSEANIRQFTIDAFLLGQIRYFDGNGLPFISREEKQGECQIRRLDGSLRLTEYIFVANFVPFRHLFRFRNDRECARIKRAAA